MGLIFRSALPEELEEENRAEDVALSPDAIKRCLVNMLTALDRDTPQTSHSRSTMPLWKDPNMASVHIEEYKW